LRIQEDDTPAVRGAKLIRKTIQSLSLLKVEDMKKIPNWDESQDAFTGKPTEMEKLVAVVFDFLGPTPWITKSRMEDSWTDHQTGRTR